MPTRSTTTPMTTRKAARPSIRGRRAWASRQQHDDALSAEIRQSRRYVTGSGEKFAANPISIVGDRIGRLRHVLGEDPAGRRSRRARAGVDRQQQRCPIRPDQDAAEQSVMGIGEEHAAGERERSEPADAYRAGGRAANGRSLTRPSAPSTARSPRCRLRSCWPTLRTPTRPCLSKLNLGVNAAGLIPSGDENHDPTGRAHRIHSRRRQVRGGQADWRRRHELPEYGARAHCRWRRRQHASSGANPAIEGIAVSRRGVRAGACRST